MLHRLNHWNGRVTLSKWSVSVCHWLGQWEVQLEFLAQGGCKGDFGKTWSLENHSHFLQKLFETNLFSIKAVQASIDYIHNNPVKRGLCIKARDWCWSSALFYETDGQQVDELLPKITPLPAEFWSGPGS